MKKFLWLGGLFSLLIMHEFAYAAVEQARFISPSQTVATGELSAVLTVQTQNSAGEAEKVTETFDLTFRSSQSAGEFLNSSGQPVSLVMSKNSSNRNFYYRSSEAGEATLTVTLTGRETGVTFVAEQVIGVGATASQENRAADPGEAGTGGTQADTLSSHSAPEELSDLAERIDLKIGAGRPRVVPVNTPVLFELTSNFRGLSTKPVITWSFGDGSTKRGERTQHRYFAPGHYVVVVTARYGAKHATARTSVTVFEPRIRLEPGANGEIVLTNQSSHELNLGDWFLWGGEHGFRLPPETIIAAGGSINFAPKITGLKPVKRGVALRLNYPGGELAAATEESSPPPPRPLVQVPVVPARVPLPVVAAPAPVPSSTPESPEFVALSTTSLVIPKPIGWWGRSMLSLKRLWQD